MPRLGSRQLSVLNPLCGGKSQAFSYYQRKPGLARFAH